MKPTMTSWLAESFERFVALKHATGATYTSQLFMLRNFDAFVAREAPSPPLRRESIASFLASLQHLTPRGRDNVVSVVWQALRYARLHGAPVERLPPRPSAPPSGARLRPPRLVTQKEICAIIAHARQLTSWKRTEISRRETFATLYGLMWTTGLRISEAVGLNVGDIDFTTGLLTVQRGKFGKSRVLPLKPSTLHALGHYLDDPWRLVDRDAPAPLFTSSRRTRLTDDIARRVFRKLSDSARLKRPLPTTHHLRHSFAVLCVQRWYRDGRDINTLLPVLSTYLGHTSVQNTRTYLYQNGLLLEEACTRFAANCASLDEVLS